MSNDVIFCSFYTDDEYYRNHAETLRANLELLGLDYELREVHKAEGEQWPDICRKKIGFIADVCRQHPDKKVFWMDVDCTLASLPDYVRNFSADIIGFQRGFSSPLRIGYGQRTRFWEPCFWGINTTPLARKMVEDAYELEQRAEVRATDDYFFEEAWRANAGDMTFQLVPSNAVVGRGKLTADSREAFFSFGSSGNVDQFAGKVQQHKAGRRSLRKVSLQFAKRVEAALPAGLSKQARLVVDLTGVTGLLTKKKSSYGDPARAAAHKDVLREAQAGNTAGMEAVIAQFRLSYVEGPQERATFEVARSFARYADVPGKNEIPLSWWVRPYPGNYGDWLSPMIVHQYSGARVVLHPLTQPIRRKHMIAVGSVGRFIKSSSVVFGTGISTEDLRLHPRATYISVRGPLTAKLVKESGGPTVESMGDPAILLSRMLPMQRGASNGRVALIRHFTHRSLPIRMPDHMDELEVLMSHPDAIRDFIAKLHEYDYVITSAMHVLITCQSYGLPCGLVSFEGYEDNVHGTGIKYSDYSLGAGLGAINPQVVPLNLKAVDLQYLVSDVRVSDAKLDEVEAAAKAAAAQFIR